MAYGAQQPLLCAECGRLLWGKSALTRHTKTHTPPASPTHVLRETLPVGSVLVAFSTTQPYDSKANTWVRVGEMAWRAVITAPLFAYVDTITARSGHPMSDGAWLTVVERTPESRRSVAIA